MDEKLAVLMDLWVHSMAEMTVEYLDSPLAVRMVAWMVFCSVVQTGDLLVVCSALKLAAERAVWLAVGKASSLETKQADY